MKSIQRFLNVLKKERTLEAVYIYGSYVMGRAKFWSDVDLAIVSRDFPDDTCEEQARLLRLAAMIDDRIEPRPFKPKEFEISDPLVNEIIRTGIKLL